MNTENERLAEIAAIIEHVDNRCMACDGRVPATLEVMTQAEISRIYELAKGDAIGHPAESVSEEGEVIGRLNVSRFRGSDAMVNADFDYLADLPDGNYPLYLHPQPSTPGAVSDEDAREADEVLPCPFCHDGGSVVVNELHRDGARWAPYDNVSCIDCGASVEGIDKWNRRAAPPAQAVSVPDGFVLVPKEPTEAMMAAAWDHAPLDMEDMTDGYFGQAYRDMLAAAPRLTETQHTTKKG